MFLIISIVISISLMVLRMVMMPSAFGGFFKAKALREEADGIWAAHARDKSEKLTYHFGPDKERD